MQWLIDIIYDLVAARMQGMILMWSGTIATVPDGWVLCDGNNGTPDLRDKFVIGAKQDDAGVAKTNVTGALTQSGGDFRHTHSFDADLHYHESLGIVVVDVGTEQDAWDRTIPKDFTGTSATTGVTDEQDDVNVPYFALAYIMKT